MRRRAAFCHGGGADSQVRFGIMGASLVMSFCSCWVWPGKVDISNGYNCLAGMAVALAFVTIGLDTKFSELKAAVAMRL